MGGGNGKGSCLIVRNIELINRKKHRSGPKYLFWVLSVCFPLFISRLRINAEEK